MGQRKGIPGGRDSQRCGARVTGTFTEWKDSYTPMVYPKRHLKLEWGQLIKSLKCCHEQNQLLMIQVNDMNSFKKMTDRNVCIG